MKGEIWMSEDEKYIEKTTQDLLNSQQKLLDYHKSELKGLNCWKTVPDELIEIIVEYSAPCAEDMRIAWYDDEDHSQLMIGYSTPEDAKEPDCVIM
jgi:hypothetical protein